MKTITLSARYDGKHIILEEPHNLDPGTPLLVTVLPGTDTTFTADFHSIAENGLAEAYGDNEPDYPDSMIAEPNPDYGATSPLAPGYQALRLAQGRPEAAPPGF